MVRNDDHADWEAAWALFPGNIACVWRGALHATTVAEILLREAVASRLIPSRPAFCSFTTGPAVLGDEPDVGKRCKFLAVRIEDSTCPVAQDVLLLLACKP